MHYADVALLATALSNELLADTLRESFLAPLEAERDGGAAWRRTLRAYLDTGHNASTAAAALGVSRKTVSARLRAIEARLGRSLDSCAAELEVALALHEPALNP
ncbi:MAG TPA: helix-turn-helix domain-containing protein [Solirubrobacteraceae bacterium]|nr:helix-turn-helix domain-containing protein [Solirubrobacteraceae bacterium]